MLSQDGHGSNVPASGEKCPGALGWWFGGGPLMHLHPSTKLVSERRFQSLGVCPLAVAKGSGQGEGEMNFATLGWDPEFSLCMGSPTILCSWELVPSQGCRGDPGTVLRDLLFRQLLQTSL